MKNISKSSEFAIRVFACLFILAGVESIFGMIYGLFQRNLRIDFTVLGIFIGKGLLDRKELWWKWAVFLAWLGIVFTPLFSAIYALIPAEHSAEVMGLDVSMFVPSYTVYILLAVFFAFSLWQRRVLAKPEVRGAFTEEGGERNAWFSVIVAFAILVSCIGYGRTYLMRRILESIGHYEATIQVFDARTGERLNPAVISQGRSPGQIFPQVSYSATPSRDGFITLTVSWLAYSPIIFHISSEGYGEKHVILTPDRDGKILRIELEQEEASKTGSSGRHLEPNAGDAPQIVGRIHIQDKKTADTLREMEADPLLRKCKDRHLPR